MESEQKPQPPPERNQYRDVQTLVMLDLVKRRRFGIAKYGTALQPFNGRDALRDAYEESLDLPCYLRQMIAERDGAELSVEDTQTFTDLRLAEEIDQARNELVQAYNATLNALFNLFESAGFRLPQTYELNESQQLLRDVELKLASLSRDNEELAMLREREDGNYWVWQGDGLDALETIVCPVIIRPEKLLPMYERFLVPAAPSEPLPLIMHCPRCGFQHADEEEPQCESTEHGTNLRCVKMKGHERLGGVKGLHSSDKALSRWTNPPHRTHQCSKCNCRWRPADVFTVGVKEIKTRGESDTWP